MSNEKLDDLFDQLFADNLALRILTMRMWGYFMVQAGNDKEFVARHKQMSLESVDAWKIAGHRDPEKLRRLAKETINGAFDSILRGKPATSPLQ